MEAARRMRDAKNADVDTLIKAVRLNWKLWTIFQSNLVDPEAAIPKPIRENMLSLSNFVDRRSVEILAKPEPHLVDALININAQIAGGLMTIPEAPAAPAPTPGSDRQPINEVA
jgi:flagellar protein FlaF